MQIEDELRIEAIESGGMSRTIETIRKMAGQMSRGAGYARAQARFLGRVVNLVYSSSRDAPLKARVMGTIRWIMNNEDPICKRLGWTKLELIKARGILAVAGNVLDSTSCRKLKSTLDCLPLEERAEVVELGKILGYVDQVAKYSLYWRRYHQACSNRAILQFEKAASDPPVSLAELKRDDALYHCLPSTFRKRLERTARKMEAA
jgi:hypothetical protein